MHETSEESVDIMLLPTDYQCTYTNAVNMHTICFYLKNNSFGYTY